MDAFDADEAPASRWGGAGGGDDLAEALSHVLPLLAVDDRCRCACVSRAWREAASAPPLWAELEFSRCATRVNAAALIQLCCQAGAALRDLRLDAPACARLTGADFVAALRGGRCAGVRRIHAHAAAPLAAALSPALARKRAAACPQLERVACSVHSCPRLTKAAEAAAALPGPTKLVHLVDSSRSVVTAQLIRALPRSVTELDVEVSDRSSSLA